ncbi:MAG: hypothetical protein OYL97_22765 [Candidatus Poribacteria bacterium]|nr:hypothetical protein [Candidatus Poribacteria bacterium]
MRKLSEVGIRTEASKLVSLLQASEDPDEWAHISTELIPILIAYWDEHPHSAMEMLEITVNNLSIELAKPLVREVILAWRNKPDYNPDAGGNADHCYLSALILSDNFDLAEYPWVERVLPKTLNKELNYKREMRDYDRKFALLKTVQYASRESSRLPE